MIKMHNKLASSTQLEFEDGGLDITIKEFSDMGFTPCLSIDVTLHDENKRELIVDRHWSISENPTLEEVLGDLIAFAKSLARDHEDYVANRDAHIVPLDNEA